MRWLLVLVALAGCKRISSTGLADALERNIAVTVEARPGVPQPFELIVVLTYGIETTTLRVDLEGAPLPLRFDVPAQDRTGPVSITIEGLDGAGNVVGRGTKATTFESTAVNVRLENLDFVVNTVYPGNQFLTNDFEAVGLQLASLDQTWLATFRTECSACTVYGRRFDDVGMPQISGFNGRNQFPIGGATLTLSSAIPAVASNNVLDIYLVAWDSTHPSTSAQGVTCTVLDRQGAELVAERVVVAEPADVVTVAPLESNNFVITWQTFTTVSEVRAMTVTPDCLVNTEPFTVSGVPGASGARRGQAASNGGAVIYVWVVDGEVYARFAADSGPPGFRRTLIPKDALSNIDYVRVVPWGAGFGVAVRWSSNDGLGPGRIELYHFTQQGDALWGRIITEQSGSDFASNKAFGVAARGDGTGMVAWHVCGAGPGSCDVRGRIVGADGTLLGEERILATTVIGDQTDPSVTALVDRFVVAWNDNSAMLPDQSSGAVRARIIYPD